MIRRRLDLSFFGASSGGSKSTGASNTNSSDPFDMSTSVIHPVKAMPRQMRNKWHLIERQRRKEGANYAKNNA